METPNHTPGVTSDRLLSKASLRRLLDDLDPTAVAGPKTLYTTPETSDLSPFSSEEWLTHLIEVAPQIGSSETGAAVFWSHERKLIVLPPFPIERDQYVQGWDTSQLRALLNKEYLLGVVLLRLGRFLVGVFQGDALLSSKTDTRFVKGRHSAGGTSQMRFQRVREKQIHEIFKKACSVVRDKFDPYEDRLEHIFLGGERLTLNDFRKQCDYLQKLAPRIRKRVLNVRKPKHEALEKIPDLIWQSRVITLGS